MIRALLLAVLLGAFAGGAPTVATAQALFNTAVGFYSAPVTSLRDMPFRTVIRQQYDYSCGSAALATLLRYHYRRSVNEAQVFQAMYALGDQAKIRQVGFSLLDMKTYLKSLGMTGIGYRERIEELASRREPAIAVIRVGAYQHFVVLKGVADGKVLVGDPALGLKAYPTAEFAKVWNGVVFVIDPKDASGAFNLPEEWGAFPRARSDSLTDRDLASFTRALPPLYQISMVRISP